MSRIHDALKKAAQERLSLPPAPSGEAADPASKSTSEELRANGLNALATAVRRHGFVGLEAHETNGQWCDNLATSLWAPDLSKVLFPGQSSAASSVEAFRTLKTRLYLLRKQKPLRKILVSSPLSQDGKTFVSANLAQALAQQDGRVLLIDADLRYSKLHASFGAALSPGLTEYLKGDCGKDTIVQKGSVRNIFLIPGGTHTEEATELLTSGRLEELVHKLSPSFDWIILDSPPVIPVSDAKIIGELCDGVLMVVRSGSTTLTWARKACREFADNQLLGIVLNGVSPKSLYGSSGYYAQAKMPRT